MNGAERQAAEAVLRLVCVGAEVSGLRFGRPGLVMLFDHYQHPKQVPYDELFLRMESRWGIFDYKSVPLSDAEARMPRRDLAQQLADIARLAGRGVTEVRVGQESPDLYVTFHSGDVLVVNGHDAEYETWELATLGAKPREYRVIAAPGDRLAVWGQP